MTTAPLLKYKLINMLIVSLVTLLTACGGGGNKENQGSSSDSAIIINSASSVNSAPQLPSAPDSSVPSSPSSGVSTFISSTSSFTQLANNTSSSASSIELMCVSPEVALANGSCEVPPPPQRICDYYDIAYNSTSHCFVADHPYPIYQPKADEVVIFINSESKSFYQYTAYLWSDEICDGWADTQTDAYGNSVAMPFNWSNTLRVSNQEFEGYSDGDPLYGAYFVLKIKPGSTCGNFIIRSGGLGSHTKDLRINFSPTGSVYDRMFFMIVDPQSLPTARVSQTPIDIYETIHVPPVITPPVITPPIETPTLPNIYSGILTIPSTSGSPDAYFNMGYAALRICNGSINNLVDISCVSFDDDLGIMFFDPLHSDKTPESSTHSQIMFPPPGTFTNKSHVLVRGKSHSEYFDGIRMYVNGVAADTTDNYVHWQALVPLSAGVNELVISVDNGLEYSERFVASFITQKPTIRTNVVKLDLDNHLILQFDDESNGLVSVDLISGIKTTLSHPIDDSMRPVVDMLYDDNIDCVLTIDQDLKAAIIVDMITGEHVYFAD